jgi:hypothetical protein
VCLAESSAGSGHITCASVLRIMEKTAPAFGINPNILPKLRNYSIGKPDVVIKL